MNQENSFFFLREREKNERDLKKRKKRRKKTETTLRTIQGVILERTKNNGKIMERRIRKTR